MHGRLARHQNRGMHPGLHHHRVPSALSIQTAVAELLVDECARDLARVALPQPEIHLVVRFGPQAREGLDIHALGIRQQAHRKLIRSGQRTVFAQLHLSSYQAVLGVPAAELTGRTVALQDLWGDIATRQLLDRLADTHDATAAAVVLERAIAERVATAPPPHARVQLAQHATSRLQSADVDVATVARDFGLSERHFRRLFREVVGVSPKAFATLTRFHRALDAARADSGANWSDIAIAAGYYDQAHLIADFRTIAGTTPRALLSEIHGEGAPAAAR